MKILRVFPRKTSYTPDDDMAFVGDPPLLRPETNEVYVSVCFTWDVKEGYRLKEAWSQHYPIVRIGGPAIEGNCYDGFTPGRYVKKGVIFTSRGCERNCPWCLVPSREGKLKLLEIKEGWIVQDNDILATPHWHQKKVYEMLKTQPYPCSFRGGLNARLVDDWVATQLRELRIYQVFFSADTWAALRPLERAVSKMDWLTRNHLRCYVLVGFGDESLEEAESRLEVVWDIGCLPFAQLYQPPSGKIEYSRKWRQLARRWTRPALTKALHKEKPIEQAQLSYVLT